MDITKTLRELYTEKKRLDATIARLEARRGPKPAKSSKGRRGRKSMSAAERLEVSKRMKRYWDARRTQRQALHREGAQAASNSAAD
jgi:hypothetical protein